MGTLSQRLIGEAKYLTKGTRLLAHFATERPFLLNWQLNYRCNFGCDICSFWKEKHALADELTTDEIRVVAAKLKPLGPLVISMAGGEPLLREDLPEITKILSDDHYFTLITNGWFVTRDLARSLYDNGLKDIHVSLDYANPERHDRLRQHKGAFERAVRALEILRDTRPDRRHRVHLMAVLLDDNVDEVEPLVELAEELSVSMELSLYSHRRGQKPPRPPTEPVSAKLLGLKAKYPSTFISMGEYLASFDRAISENVPGCQGGRTFFNLDDRGNVSRCIDRNDRPAGNLVSDPLEEVFARLDAQRTVDDCSACWTSCRGFADLMAGPRAMMRTLPDFYRAVAPL